MATLQYPVDVPPARLTGRFAERRSNTLKEAAGHAVAPLHGGADFAPPKPGQKGYIARAVGPGRVVATRFGTLERSVWGVPIYNASAGNYVITEHLAYDGTPFVNAFGVDHTRVWNGEAHLARLDVQVGDFVHTGDQIGVVGSTGASTGEHIHDDLFLWAPNLGDYAFDRRIDPLRVLRPWGKDSPANPNQEEIMTADIAAILKKLDIVSAQIDGDTGDLRMIEEGGKHLVAAKDGAYVVVESSEHRRLLTEALSSINRQEPTDAKAGPGPARRKLVEDYKAKSLARMAELVAAHAKI